MSPNAPDRWQPALRPPPRVALGFALALGSLVAAAVAGSVALSTWSVRGLVAWRVLLWSAVVSLVGVALWANRLVREEIRGRARAAQDREEALALQQRLLAVVSHDLRNPLCGILIAAWGLSRAGLAPQQDALARRIVGAGRRMERLIRDLLDWSRLHAGAPLPLARRDADLLEICREVAGELAPHDAARIQLEHEGDTRAVLDPDRLDQVVANLISNALKYGAPERPVRVRVAGDQREIRVEVADEGAGIPPDVQAAMFAPFWRGDHEHAGSSLGLGLFIVRTIAEAHGGQVDVASGPAIGTTFAVRLPRAALAADPPGASLSAGVLRARPSAGWSPQVSRQQGASGR
jgi:signal transduction histidine kinase